MSKKDVKSLVWNVFRYDINKREIITYNIFNHGGFVEDIEKMRKNKITSVDFKDRLKQVLMYYFWAKCEYEVVISSFPPDENSKDEKVDIYSQVMLNFDVFCYYVYSNIFETKKKYGVIIWVHVISMMKMIMIGIVMLMSLMMIGKKDLQAVIHMSMTMSQV